MATEITMDDLLGATIEYGASDLHVRANMPPELRVHGELQPIADEVLTPEDTYALCQQICSEEQLAEVEQNGGADFALAHEDGTRFRVSVFKERKRPDGLRQVHHPRLDDRHHQPRTRRAHHHD